jgi:hypothetical protein
MESVNNSAPSFTSLNLPSDIRDDNERDETILSGVNGHRRKYVQKQRKPKPANVIEKAISNFTNDLDKTSTIIGETQALFSQLESKNKDSTIVIPPQKSITKPPSSQRGKQKKRASNQSTSELTKISQMLSDVKSKQAMLEEKFSNMREGILKQLFALYGDVSRSSHAGPYTFSVEELGKFAPRL